MTTATSRASFRNERSDSSASITAHSPAPQAAFVPPARSSPPIRKRGLAAGLDQGERGHRRASWSSRACRSPRSCASSGDSSPSRSPRCSTSAPAARAAASSGLSSGIAVETTTSAPSGTFAASWPIAGSMPAAAQPLAVGRLRLIRARHARAELPRDQREAAHAGAADADEVERTPGERRSEGVGPAWGATIVPERPG